MSMVYVSEENSVHHEKNQHRFLASFYVPILFPLVGDLSKETNLYTFAIQIDCANQGKCWWASSDLIVLLRPTKTTTLNKIGTRYYMNHLFWQICEFQPVKC